MKRTTKFPGRPLPHTPPPPPNTYLHLRPVVVGSLYGSTGGYDHGVHVVHEAIRVALKAAHEAQCASREAGCDEAEAHVAASEAYVNNLPELDHIINIRTFIGAVAGGVKRGYIAASQARLLLYTAQLQLAAMTRRVQ
jgi:hypothetical protein